MTMYLILWVVLAVCAAGMLVNAVPLLVRITRTRCQCCAERGKMCEVCRDAVALGAMTAAIAISVCVLASYLIGVANGWWL